jgi:hypothetical protein
LYTPLLNLLIDKNINNKSSKENISTGQIDRVNYLSEIYINQKKEINYKNK